MTINNFKQPNKKNEFQLQNELIINNNKTLFNIKSLIPNFKNKKALLVFIILNSFWILSSLIALTPFNMGILDFLKWLTFFQGGFVGNIINKLGGIIGKLLIANLFTLIVTEKKIIQNIKNNFISFKKQIILKDLTNRFLLFGISLSLIIYNTLVGYMNPSNLILSITCLILSLNNLQNNTFISNIFTKILTTFNINNQETLNKMLFGWTIGFALNMGLSFIHSYSGYLLGIILFITSIVLSFINNKKEGVKQ